MCHGQADVLKSFHTYKKAAQRIFPLLLPEAGEADTAYFPVVGTGLSGSLCVSLAGAAFSARCGDRVDSCGIFCFCRFFRLCLSGMAAVSGTAGSAWESGREPGTLLFRSGTRYGE